MREGMMIQADTPQGRIRVIAGKENTRIFEWGNRCSKTRTLWTRTGRWYGRCGMYDPAPPEFAGFFTCKGVSRVVAEEAQLNFPSAEAVVEYFSRDYYNKHTVYRNDGIAVSYGVRPQRYEIDVDVY